MHSLIFPNELCLPVAFIFYLFIFEYLPSFSKPDSNEVCVCVCVRVRSLRNDFFTAIFSTLWNEIASEVDSHLINETRKNTNTNKTEKKATQSTSQQNENDFHLAKMTLSMCAIERKKKSN